MCRARKNRERSYRMRSSWLSPITIRVTLSPVLTRICLIHDERRRFCDLLFRYAVVYLNVHLILARLKTRQWQTLFNRNLIGIRARLRCQLLRLKNRLIRRRIQNLIFDGGTVLLALFIDTKVIHLHPEVQTLPAMKGYRNRNPAGNTRNDMRVSNHKVSSADIPRWRSLHMIRQNQGRRRKPVVVISGDVQTALPPADMVRVVDILDHDVDVVKTRSRGKGLP